MGRSIFNNMIFSYKSPTVDNFVFWLVSRFTPVKLIILSFIVTCKLTFGDSFTCSASYDALPQKFMDAKCYSELIVSYPGSPNPVFQDRGYSSMRSFGNDDMKRELPFYQWVNLALLAHAMIFHLPHLLWKTYESGYVGRLTAGLQVALSKEQKRALELCYLAKFLIITQGKHKVYTSVCIFFEACCFFICIAQTAWLVNFFNIADVPMASIDASTWSGYRNFYFPTTSLCSMTKYSSSGEPRNVDAICVLSLNHLYMNLFIFLRGWYIMLIHVTAAILIYRIVLIMPKVRSVMIRAVTPLVSKSTVISVCHQLTYSDWFFLMAVHKQMTNADFSKLIEKMFAVSQNAGKEQEETDDKSSIYEDSHKELEMSPRSTPL